jgi:putative SOS response-associated peptidase YedK
MVCENCGRFTQHYTWQEVHEFLSVFGAARNLQPRYNIAPTTSVDVVRRDPEGRRELVSMRWGLVPFFWKKSLKEVPATFNARVETLADKPMFREALQRRRCIIPASGFYEWTGAKGDKQPHLFTAADGSPILALAGLWDRWRDPASKEEILSCTIIVTKASPILARLDRDGHAALASKVRGGELSASAAAIEAGYKPRPRKPTPKLIEGEGSAVTLAAQPPERAPVRDREAEAKQTQTQQRIA